MRQFDASPGPAQLLAGKDLAYLLAEHKRERIDEAYQIAKDLIKQMPDNTPLLDTLGWIEHYRGNHREALALLNRAASGLKHVPEYHRHMAVSYQDAGNATWSQYHEACAITLEAEQLASH